MGRDKFALDEEVCTQLCTIRHLVGVTEAVVRFKYKSRKKRNFLTS